MIAEVDPAWRRRWHLRTLLWGWLHVAVSLIAVSGVIYLLAQLAAWKAWLLVLLVPLELLHALSAGLLPLSKRGSEIYLAEVEALKVQLRARAVVCATDDSDFFGGSCARRWGHDLILVATDGLTDHELLAVVAHELGHTKQSVLAKVLQPGIMNVFLAAVWLAGLTGEWWMLLAGVASGAYLRTWNLYVPQRYLRIACTVLVWAAWWWWFSNRALLLPLLACALLLTWRALGAAWSRVSELLADEAVIAVHNGHHALSSALESISHPVTPLWRRPFLTHPLPHQRGARRLESQRQNQRH